MPSMVSPLWVQHDLPNVRPTFKGKAKKHGNKRVDWVTSWVVGSPTHLKSIPVVKFDHFEFSRGANKKYLQLAKKFVCFPTEMPQTENSSEANMNRQGTC